MNNSNKGKNTVNVLLPASLDDKLVNYSALNGQSTDEVVGNALANFLTRVGKEKLPADDCLNLPEPSFDDAFTNAVANVLKLVNESKSVKIMLEINHV